MHSNIESPNLTQRIPDKGLTDLNPCMTENPLKEALFLWGYVGSDVTLLADRENKVYRVDTVSGPVALRLHRAGLRTMDQLISELDWMAAMGLAGLSVPTPIENQSGMLVAQIGVLFVDVLSWIEGEPMGTGGLSSSAIETHKAYGLLGQAMAKLHIACDSWTLPKGFSRPSWDQSGLLGLNPLWGRFWENSQLSAYQKALLLDFRAKAGADMPQKNLDYGLIHADLVPDNVIIGRDGVVIIDFDDGGFGYRLFDLVTVMNRTDRLAENQKQKDVFLDEYIKERAIDLNDIVLFSALRAVTYVGWFIPRLKEDKHHSQNQHYIDFAIQKVKLYLKI
ncbi:MAG: Ser/Thr protein kinase RdoA (MazF antagonist) [Paracoccaceae bacterium]|jgi:Ser/Thr protein kinase RdoA (MazF antagonist)